MVSYQAWVSICFETLQDRGVEISDLDDGASIMEFAGDVWTRHRDRLERMSAAEARTAALRAAETY
jgi:hypothetical protein